MAKKSSASSQPARLKSMKSEDIANRQWTEKERRTLRRVAARQAAGDDSRTNFGDIPRLTGEQLANMIRLREARPRKVAVSVRLDARMLSWLRSKGGRAPDADQRYSGEPDGGGGGGARKRRVGRR